MGGGNGVFMGLNCGKMSGLRPGLGLSHSCHNHFTDELAAYIQQPDQVQNILNKYQISMRTSQCYLPKYVIERRATIINYCGENLNGYQMQGVTGYNNVVSEQHQLIKNITHANTSSSNFIDKNLRICSRK